MSQENVEKVRASLDAINRGDTELAFKDMAPNFEFDFSRSIGFQRSAYTSEKGRNGSGWSSPGCGNRPAGSQTNSSKPTAQLVNPTVENVRPGPRIGIELQALRTTWVWTFRDGRIARITFYQEPREALEAAGLSE